MREIELLTIASIHQNVGPVVDSLLQPLGFVSLKPLQWVRSKDVPVRQMFEYRQLKGGAVAPAWGFSLDFVPHFSARTLKWHRTEKSALFDAFVDGQIHRDLVLTYMYGVSGLLDDLQSRVSAAVNMANAFWARGHDLQHVYSIVEELRSKPGSDSYTQLPIANAFCLARAGREPEGRTELERIIQHKANYPTTELGPKTVADLWRAFEDAFACFVKGAST
jgi:hypothetical protein